jgi:uncharacterized damage-inducible protein DinB
MEDNALRTQLATALAWHDAHADFDAVVADLPIAERGHAPPGLPYSPWQLLEHVRITQRDILDFCIDESYKEPHWPRDYWPEAAAPANKQAWDDSIRRYREDRKRLQQLANDPSIDLGAKVPNGNGQTFLRELLVVIDHTAHHLGQLIVVRRLLGIWPGN